MANAMMSAVGARGAPTPAYISRKEASKYLREKYSIRVSAGWLSQLASAGKGPAYMLVGRAAVYSIPALDAWVAAKAKPVAGLSQDGGADAAA